MRLKHQIFVRVQAPPPEEAEGIKWVFEDGVEMVAEDNVNLITEDND